MDLQNKIIKLLIQDGYVKKTYINTDIVEWDKYIKGDMIISLLNEKVGINGNILYNYDTFYNMLLKKNRIFKLKKLKNG